jgi:hypothetical protein
MHGKHSVKFINAQQAKYVYHYLNIKEKLLKTNASIWFNKICKINSVFVGLIVEWYQNARWTKRKKKKN